MFLVLAIIGLSILIFFHEFGHFIFAKIFKIKVEEFGIGYPPRMCGFVFNEKQKKKQIKFFWGKKISAQDKEKTIYSLNWIPFGGFNKLKGEMGEEDNSPDSFFAQVWWKKAIVAMGGVIMNLFLAFLLFSLCYFIGLPQDINHVQDGRILEPIGVQIGMIYSGSPAKNSGLKIGDIILGIDGKKIDSVEKLQEEIKKKSKQSIELTIKRGKNVLEKKIEVLPAKNVFPDFESEEGAIGIVLSKTAIVSYPWHKSLFKGMKTTISLTTQIFTGLWLILKNLVSKGKMVGQLVGPVGITSMAAEMAQAGFIYLLQFIGLLSVAIGAFQAIPFPALDGSRVLFSFIEGIKGSPINRKVEIVLINFGFYVLLMLLIFITSKEIFNLF